MGKVVRVLQKNINRVRYILEVKVSNGLLEQSKTVEKKVILLRKDQK
jgi:hypothetical protein